MCKLYRVSPLWQFSSTEQALKGYSRQLTGLLSALPHKQLRPAKGQRRGSPYVGVVSFVRASAGIDVVRIQVRQRSSAAGSVLYTQLILAILVGIVYLHSRLSYLHSNTL